MRKKKGEVIFFMISMMIAAIENDFQRDFMANIYINFYDAMLKRAKTFVSGEEEAEELIQDIFTDLIDRVETVMAVEERKLPSYLMSAVKYSAYNRYRKKKKEISFVSAEEEKEDLELLRDESALPEDIVIQKEALEELEATLSRLSERYKNVLEFKYILGLSDEEIGERLGISERSVRTSLMRARRKAYSVMKEGL